MSQDGETGDGQKQKDMEEGERKGKVDGEEEREEGSASLRRKSAEELT